MSETKSKSCIHTGCILHCLTMLANLALIGFILFLYSEAHGHEANIALLILIPPVLSIITLRKGGDKEERQLKMRIRKAELRQQLDTLKPYDTDGQS